MSPKILHHLKIRILEVIVILSALFGALLWHNVLTNDALVPAVRAGVLPLSGTASSLALKMPSARIPVRFKIPSIGVDAAVEKVSLASDGSLGVPKKPLDTGWYDFGTRPGDVGSAIIDGHVDWWYGATAVFAELHRVKAGDKIEVVDDNGAVISFVVREIRTYDASAQAQDVFSSNDGKAHLNIITCDGVWDKSAHQYSQRLVVFADKVSE